MLRITTRSELISHWIRMLQIFGEPRSSAASQRYLSSAGSLINTFGFRFLISTTVPDRRLELLDEVADYILSNGLADLSLRPLAAAINTSPRMLLYFFGTKGTRA